MPCFSECPSVLFIIQRGQCHIIRFISYDEPEEEGKSFFDVRVSPLFFSRPAVHCNALLCFRVRHEIQSLGTWGGGEGRGRELGGKEERQLGGVGGGASEGARIFVVAPERTSTTTTAATANRQCNCYNAMQWLLGQDYRVSHPIVREISSCFVLGVPLPCLGSS